MHLKLAAFLYKHLYFLYKPLYFLFKHYQDAPEIRWYKKIIKEGDIVLDIGANIGFTAHIFSKLVGPSGKVYAFEPDEDNFKHLCDFIQSHKIGNVYPVKKAVSHSNGKIKFYRSNRLNVDHRTYKVDEFNEVVEIESITIDDFLNTKNIKRVDFIKMDIQGYEMNALKGMEKTLKSNDHLVILSECWPNGLKQAGSSVEAFYNYLKSNGYNIYLIKNNSLEPLNETNLMLLNQYKGDNFENIIFSKKTLQ